MLRWSPAERAVGGLVEPGGHTLGVELVAAGQLGQLVILLPHMYAMFDNIWQCFTMPKSSNWHFVTFDTCDLSFVLIGWNIKNHSFPPIGWHSLPHILMLSSYWFSLIKLSLLHMSRLQSQEMLVRNKIFVSLSKGWGVSTNCPLIEKVFYVSY